MQSTTSTVEGQRVKPFRPCGQRDLAGGWEPNGSEGWPRRVGRELEEAKDSIGEGTHCVVWTWVF